MNILTTFPPPDGFALGVCLFVIVLGSPAIAQELAAQPTYRELKQELKSITDQKNRIVNRYLSSSRDLQLAYQQYVSPEHARKIATEVKLLKRVAPVEEIVRLDSLNALYRQIEAKLKTTPDENGIYDVVDKRPCPKLGMKVFYESIARQLRYPEGARQRQIEGKVYVQFVVDEYGTITRPEVIRGLGYGCDREVVRVLRKAQHWVPGRINNHAVRTRVMLPISFRLQKEKTNKELKNFVVTDHQSVDSYEGIKRALRKISQLRAKITRKHYTSSRDLQLAYQAKMEEQGTNEKVDVNLLKGVLSADEVARLERLSALRSQLQQKLKYYPNANGVFEMVDQAPRPHEGYEAFYTRLAQRLRYPTKAIEKKIGGKVYVKLIVDERGKLSKVEAIKGIGAGCDYEAVRVLQRMPHWQPALIDGKPVKAEVIIPIVFALNRTKDNSKE